MMISYILLILTSYLYREEIKLDIEKIYNCSEFDENFRIRELSSRQNFVISEIIDLIEPNFSIVSCFLDPFIFDCCYIFVENSLSKEIIHYTIFLNDKNQIYFVIQKILFDELLINKIFKSCFAGSNLTNGDHREFCILPLESFNIKFYALAKTIIFEFDCMLYKTNYRLAHFFSHQPKNTRYSTIAVVDLHKKVCNFIFMCINLRNEKFQLTCLTLDIKDYLSLKIKIDVIFRNKISFLRNYMETSLSEKQVLLFASTDIIYRTIRNCRISSLDVTRFTFSRIKSLKNKLNRFTLMLCFCNLYNKLFGNKNVLKIIRLMTFIWIFFDKFKIENFDPESLNLLHNISKSTQFREIPNQIFNELCILNKPHDISFKILLMKRYLCFASDCNSNIFFTLDFLTGNQISFNYTWLIFRCCIYTKIKIFNF